MLCSASVSALHIVFSSTLCESTAKWETCQVFKEDILWCAFSWSICNQFGHFIRCMQSSSFQGYDIHKSWEDIIGLEEQWPKTKLSERGRRTLKRIVS